MLCERKFIQESARRVGTAQDTAGAVEIQVGQAQREAEEVGWMPVTLYRDPRTGALYSWEVEVLPAAPMVPMTPDEVAEQQAQLATRRRKREAR
jgi:hypothetical protein